MIQYRIYATLLDGFQDYLGSSEIYQEYWGFSEDPSKTEEEFEREQFLGFIDRINRKPFDSEPADKGTIFNEIIDVLITGIPTKKDKVENLKADREKGVINSKYNGRCFDFPLQQTRDFAQRFQGALCQVYTDAILPTKYGDVMLYGYIDELMPLSVHDIKTTSKYKAGKFRSHWQKIVYPFCLCSQGCEVYDFEYNVARFKDKDNNFDTYDECYTFVPERDVKLLTEHIERLIEFIELNRELITDKKIFNEINQL